MSTSGTAWRTGRSAALDGLRGLAILLVLVGHAGSDAGLGALAAAGVTLFFGLSGYLITNNLRDGYDRDGRINLRRFYSHRATRLGPPLFVMLAVVCALSWPGWGPVLAASTWTANYALFFRIHLDPFGHTWSLSVEEQFYLLWPLLLGFLLRRGIALRVALGLVVVLMIYRTDLDVHGFRIYAYSALETAGTAILVGAVVALARWRIRGVWAAVGFGGMLLAGAGAIVVGNPYWLVVPLAATPFVTLMVAAADNAAWLAWRPLTACGVASYSLYLWHEPGSFLVAGRLTPVGVVCGVLMGVVAYVLVEAPVMRWRSRSLAVVDDGDLACDSVARVVVDPGVSRRGLHLSLDRDVTGGDVA